MRVVRHPRTARRDCAIAIGSFDGVHVGHRSILEHVRGAAEGHGLDSAVLTFEPLPREFFDPAGAPARLSSLAEKLAALARCGIDRTHVQHFDARFAALSAEEFEQRVRRVYGARWIVVGEDFRYGARRAGDVERLTRAGRALGFEVEVLAAVRAFRSEDDAAWTNLLSAIQLSSMHGELLPQARAVPPELLHVLLRASERSELVQAGLVAAVATLYGRGDLDASEPGSIEAIRRALAAMSPHPGSLLELELRDAALLQRDAPPQR